MDYIVRICAREGFRIVEFSIQVNHIHLICEADSQAVLSRAMNGILSGMARTLNRHWERRGKVFADRYHAEPIHKPTQCRNALRYVLFNAKKHGSRPLDSEADPCSTAPWFTFDPQLASSLGTSASRSLHAQRNLPARHLLATSPSNNTLRQHPDPTRRLAPTPA